MHFFKKKKKKKKKKLISALNNKFLNYFMYKHIIKLVNTN